MRYPEDPKFAAYFFRRHSFAELQEWTEALRFFRFCRAYGGHANDGDDLRAALRVDSEDDLITLAAGLGIALRELPASAPQPQPGLSYSIEEFAAFRSRVEAYPRFEQPCHVALGGVPCFVYVHRGRLELSLSGADGDPYEVSQRDFQHALKLEALIAPFAARIIDPPLDGDRCFTS